MPSPKKAKEEKKRRQETSPAASRTPGNSTPYKRKRSIKKETKKGQKGGGAAAGAKTEKNKGKAAAAGAKKGHHDHAKHHKNQRQNRCPACNKLYNSRHLRCFPILFCDGWFFIFNKQNKKLLGLDAKKWGKLALVLIFQLCVVTAVAIAWTSCWPAISRPGAIREEKDYRPVNAQKRLPYAFTHFPAYYNLAMRELKVDLSPEGNHTLKDIYAENRDATRLKGSKYPMRFPGVNWIGHKTAKKGFHIDKPNFGNCSRLSTSRMATDAAKGKLCIYAALNRVYPIEEDSLQMQCYTREAKGSEHFQWVKNGRGLKFTFFPPSIVVRKNFFNFGIHSKNRASIDKFQAPGVAVFIENIRINFTYAVQCRYKKAVAMCPELENLGDELCYSNHGGFLVVFGIRASDEDIERVLGPAPSPPPPSTTAPMPTTTTP